MLNIMFCSVAQVLDVLAMLEVAEVLDVIMVVSPSQHWQ